MRSHDFELDSIFLFSSVRGFTLGGIMGIIIDEQ